TVSLDEDTCAPRIRGPRTPLRVGGSGGNRVSIPWFSYPASRPPSAFRHKAKTLADRLFAAAVSLWLAHLKGRRPRLFARLMLHGNSHSYPNIACWLACQEAPAVAASGLRGIGAFSFLRVRPRSGSVSGSAD